MLTQRSEVANARSSLAKSSSDLANEGGRGAAGQQGELGKMVDDNICGGGVWGRISKKQAILR